VDRHSARWVILLAALALVAFIVGGLYGKTTDLGSGDRSYQTVCQQAEFDVCHSWQTQALAQCVGVLLLAAAAWTYNERLRRS
jgi:hypothetical protein